MRVGNQYDTRYFLVGRKHNLKDRTVRSEIFDNQSSFIEPRCQSDTPQVSHGRMPRVCLTKERIQMKALVT